jgi:hypothetical protein
MKDFQIPEAPDTKGSSIELKTASGGWPPPTTVTVDGPETCAAAEHTSQGWHLYWHTDSNGQRVRVVRLCPREAERIRLARASKESNSDRKEDY